MSEPLEMVSYVPVPARIADVLEESSDTRTFVVEPAPTVTTPWHPARPGQFVMLSLLGDGEAAFTISSRDEDHHSLGRRISLTVRRVGSLTSALFALGPGDPVGIRGPFGRGFPTWPASADVLFVAGGCGLAPLRAAIEERLAARSATAHATIVYGAKDPGQRIFRADLDRWRSTPRVALHECVERSDDAWRGRVGSVEHVLDDALREERPRFAAVCGPAGMMSTVARQLVRAGVAPAEVSLAIERQMKCGFGICGRCYVGHRLACIDGPVFPLDELCRIDAAFGDAAGGAGGSRRAQRTTRSAILR